MLVSCIHGLSRLDITDRSQWIVQYAACVLKTCQTQCQVLPPQQTRNCHSHLSLRFECHKGHVIQSSHRSVSSISALPLGLDQKVAPETQREGMWGGSRGREPCRLCRLRFTFDFRVHVLPITDKGEAVLCSMWFHLEQVKQCRKIDPSSVAFQRPVRISAKS